MQRSVDAFLSPQSAYSYFVAPRLLRLDRSPDVRVRFRLVRPGVLRIPDTYAHRGPMEEKYFRLDIARTAAFLGLEYADPDPDPVAFEPGSYWRAQEEQPRIPWLMDLLMAAADSGRGLAAFDSVMRLIFNGRTPGWHLGDHVRTALEAAGLDWNRLQETIAHDRARLRATLLANDAALLASGHWGVPCCVLEGEPFFGQDRFDQLIWRLGLRADCLPE